MGGHLARLATHPEYQRQGIGCAILRDLLIQFKQRGAARITVNTQEDNLASIALYENAGFMRTGETYPVYQYLPQ
jgi:ribosomal protein S18 acetylase RimI-like enzyme